jgi:hypothetical protein
MSRDIPERKGARTQSLRAIGATLTIGLGLLSLRCDWLFLPDSTPPHVTMVVPQDSTIVLGTIVLNAAAFDSGGIASVNFLVDDSVVGTGTPDGSNYQMIWSSAALPMNTWHRFYARATDLANNVGYSDTVRAVSAGSRELDVFHGSFSLVTGHYTWVEFDAVVGDSLVGEARISSGSNLTDFFWCDSANFVLFQNQQSFTAFDRQPNQSAVAVSAPVPAAGNYKIVFSNGTSGIKTIWARFVIRRRG